MGGQWLVDLVGSIQPPSDSFASARKVTPSRVTVRLNNGKVFERELAIPVGAAGSATRDRHVELVGDKFAATGGSRQVAKRFADLENVNAGELGFLLGAALSGG
jgi:hypothetical protein